MYGFGVKPCISASTLRCGMTVSLESCQLCASRCFLSAGSSVGPAFVRHAECLGVVKFCSDLHGTEFFAASAVCEYFPET